MKGTVRILHCDDCASMRVLLRGLLRRAEDLEVVEGVEDHASAVERAAAVRPDLVVLDLDARRDEQVVRRLREVCGARIIVLSGRHGLERDPIALAADAFVAKQASPDAIVRAIRSAAV